MGNSGKDKIIERDKLSVEVDRLHKKVLGLDKEIRLENENPKGYVGLCYKYRNSYGGNHSPWWMYMKVIGYNKRKKEIKYVTFQHTSLNKIDFELRSFKYGHYDSGFKSNLDHYIPITKSRFNREKKKMMQLLKRKFDE